MASFAEKAGGIFMELVSVRTDIAQMNGYDNYVDYADDIIYERNYPEKDLEQMKSEVRTVSSEHRDSAAGRREAVSTGGFDIDELHKYSGRVFGRDAAAFNKANLTDVADVIVEGCELDDWKRAVYKNPDMTVDEMSSLYKEICLEYGETPYSSMEHSWCIYSHNFSSPMYCISCAISAFVALQIWKESLDDQSSCRKALGGPGRRRSV